MPENDRIELAIKKLVVGYPHAKISKETVALYIRLLSDIPPGDLHTVVEQAIAESEFLPTVASLRERYFMLTRHLAEKTSAEAWLEVVDKIRRVGYMRLPKFESEVTTRVVNSMGWRNLCESENPGVERAQFMRMYDEIIGRERRIDGLLPDSRRLVESSAKQLGMRSVRDLLGDSHEHPEDDKGDG